jgi:hypothetical protein
MMLLAGISMLIIGAAGVVLVMQGIMGVRIDDHPLCRRCGFDLIGMPAGGTKCAECGADVDRPGAVIIGHRQRRRSFLLLGLVLIAAPLGTGMVMFSLANKDHLKPTWWLVYEVRHHAALPVAALNELSGRFAAGTLSNSQVDAVTDIALAEQADTTKRWVWRWGDWIESAHSAGKVDGRRWKQYALNGFIAPRLTVRSQVRRGEDVPYQLASSANRYGGRTQLWTSFTFTASGDLIADRHRSDRADDARYGLSSWGTAGGLAAMDVKKTAMTHDGPQTLDVTVRYTIGDSSELGSRQFQLSAPWTLVAAGAQTVTLIRDPGAQVGMLKAMTIEKISDFGTGYYEIRGSCAPLPHPAAFDVMVRAGGELSKLASMSFSGSSTSYAMSGVLRRPGARVGIAVSDRVDVILRANPDAARETVGITSVWDGDVLIKNVPIVPATTRPMFRRK